MRILVFFLTVLFLVSFPSIASAASVPIPQLTSVLFNGGAGPETAQALDLTGANWTSVALTNGSGNIYTALVDVTVSTGGTQVTRHLTVNFKLQPTPTPKTSPRDSFEIGIEAGEQHDVSKVELVAESGAKWVRLNFVGSNWAAGSNDVNTYNNIINAYRAKNIKIIGLIGAQSISGGYDRGNPGSFTQKFTNTADAIINRFGDRVKVYELFNEPNDWAGGNSSQVPERYFAEYLASIYRKVKVEGGRADIFLNSGPLFSFDQNSGASYLQETFNQGKSLSGASSWESIKSQTGSYPLDGVGYHIYVAQGMGDQGQVESKILANLNAISGVIAANDPGKKIWITEMGWGTGPGRVTEAVQASNLQKAFDVLKIQASVRMGMWFTLIDFDSSEWGLIRLSGTKKLAWSSFKRVTSQLPTPIPTATVTPTPSNRPTSIPTITPTSSPRASSSPTPAPFNEQEYLSEPESPEENPDFPPPIPSQPEIRIILFGNQPLDPSGQSPLSIHLNGQPGQRSYVLLPVSLSYSQGPTRNLAIQFNYLEESRGTTTSRSSTAGGRTNTGAGNTNQPKYDLNSDKIINIVDVEIFFNEWRNKLSGGTILKGDFNGDGVINSIDYAMLKNLIGKRV